MQPPAEAVPDPVHPAGHALIRVRGATRAAADPRFLLRRPDGYDQAVLGEAGWQVAETLLAPTEVTADGEDLVLHVGPAVANHLEQGNYRFSLPASGIETTLVWPNISPLYVEPRPQSVLARRPAVVARPSPVPPPPPPAPDTPPPEPSRETPRETPETERLARLRAAAQPTEPPRRTRAVSAPVILAVVILLVAVGVGRFGPDWWGQEAIAPPPSPAPPSPVAPSPAPPSPVAPSPAPQPPAAQPQAAQAPASPAATGLETLPVTEAIARAGSPAVIQQEAERRLHGDRPDDALLMIEAAADRGHAPAKAMLGRLYDPNQPRQAGIRADARQAARYYREAVRGGDNSVNDARAALRASLDEQARRGDPNAALIMQDFWP